MKRIDGGNQMNLLTRTHVAENPDLCKKAEITREMLSQSEKVIQFGEGNFLRAFVDWMIHRMNAKGLFQGSAVLVQPIANGMAEAINAQEGVYTLLLRGIEEGKLIERKEILTSVSRAINPYKEWEKVLACAENPEIEFVVSNTTEAGIVLDSKDRLDFTPPHSYPGKLAAYLWRRYQTFSGAADKGMVILPCELIDRNGDQLKKAVQKLAVAWSLPQEFNTWIQESNYFLNTLVDRVVTGYPKDEIESLEKENGYIDRLIDTGEFFHLWIIEGPAKLEKRLPLAQAGLNVIWTDDMTPYRTRKVRILNGAHTSSVPAAFLYGLETVGEMMDDPILGKYVRQTISREIVPSMDMNPEMLKKYADAVVERFQNPFIKHYLSSILLNSASKFKTRVVPSLLQFAEKNGGLLPERLCFSFAAWMMVYRHGCIEKGLMQAKRAKGAFIMQDDMVVLKFFQELWQSFNEGVSSIREVTEKVLSASFLWGKDLTMIPGLTDKVAGYVEKLEKEGFQKVMAALVKE
jgi:tagaturonate reductase